MRGGVHTWPPRQKLLRTARRIAVADAEDGQRNLIPGLPRLRHTSLVVWWSIVLGSTSFRHRSHDPTSINNDCNLVQVCKHWDHSPRRDEQENQEKEKDKNKKRDQGKGGMCVVEREREVLMAGAIRVSGLNGPMGSTSLPDARGTPARDSPPPSRPTPVVACPPLDEPVQPTPP